MTNDAKVDTIDISLHQEFIFDKLNDIFSASFGDEMNFALNLLKQSYNDGEFHLLDIQPSEIMRNGHISNKIVAQYKLFSSSHWFTDDKEIKESITHNLRRTFGIAKIIRDDEQFTNVVQQLRTCQNRNPMRNIYTDYDSDELNAKVFPHITPKNPRMIPKLKNSNDLSEMQLTTDHILPKVEENQPRWSETQTALWLIWLAKHKVDLYDSPWNVFTGTNTPLKNNFAHNMDLDLNDGNLVIKKINRARLLARQLRYDPDCIEFVEPFLEQTEIHTALSISREVADQIDNRLKQFIDILDSK